jgi:hypothetical protein
MRQFIGHVHWGYTLVSWVRRALWWLFDRFE